MTIMTSFINGTAIYIHVTFQIININNNYYTNCLVDINCVYIIMYNYIVLTMFSHLYIECTTQILRNYFSNPFNIFLRKYFISQILSQPPNLGKFLKKSYYQ